MNRHAPTVGIIGSAGAYGRWLTRFLRERLQLVVCGQDPADPDSRTAQELIDTCDVLIFSAPIRHTAAVIADYVRLAGARSQAQLWLDVTSIKAEPVAAMLRSEAEVVGLHPMTAPPKAPTLKGRVMVVSEARLHTWRPFVEHLLNALEANLVRATPDQHDRMMAVVQAMVHASHLAQAATLRIMQEDVGHPSEILPFRSASFEMDLLMMSRILSGNPAIYEDIQFGNAAVPKVLAELSRQVDALQAAVACGDAGRETFRAQFLQPSREHFGEATLAEGNHAFERIGYLLADLSDNRALSVHLPEDRPGSLRALLGLFEEAGVNLASIHSSRTPQGEVHFRFTFTPPVTEAVLAALVARIDGSGIGRVLG
jgi:prephenate dehydrogenase